MDATNDPLGTTYDIPIRNQLYRTRNKGNQFVQDVGSKCEIPIYAELIFNA